MTPHPRGSVPPADADDQAVSGAKIRPAQRLIMVMLLAAATVDLARCGLVLATGTHAVPAAGLIMASASAAMLSLWTARGCHSGRRWSAWAALLIGLASAPQAATTGFRLPYLLPDTATAALGVLLAVTVLATVETPDTSDDSAEGLIRCDTSRLRIGLPHSDAPDRKGTNGQAVPETAAAARAPEPQPR
jgi:hypothetical protein